MRGKHDPASFTVIALFMFGTLLLLGCEGERGPAGPAGSGVEGVEYTYLGKNGENCKHCHEHLIATVANTKHTHAFEDLGAANQTNLYCAQCHTTGFDSEVAFGDTQILPESYGPDLYGYDDYVGIGTPEAAQRRADLEGIQCESCHGPMGPEFNQNMPRVSFATGVDGDVSVSLCYPCHQTQLDEWVDSGHGSVNGIDLEDFNEEFGRQPCAACHTSEGFSQSVDPALASYEFEEYNFIGCPTCHDPHVGAADEGNAYQIRTLGPVEVLYAPGFEPGDNGIPQMVDRGTGQVCAQCHHGRRNTSNVEGQIANGTSHFGPHGSPQMDAYIGYGCYEIEGYDYDRVAAHQGIINSCVYCHMVREVEQHGELQDHAFHSFEPDVGNCLPCHTLTDFNFHNIQTIVEEKMDELAVLLGFANLAAFLDHDIGFDSQADGVEVWEREAAYALVFSNNDGSRGVHNPEYIIDLLDNAISYAQEKTRLAAR
ncbi:MAG: ammonia-forming cytochrome c nitrite reductase subunit c552 [bacterium]